RRPSPATPFLLLTFLLSRPGDPRDLHSFPTRRSSDLAGPDAAATRLRQHVGRAVDPDHRGLGPALDQQARGVAWPAAEIRDPLRDRKSTRLNSSHVKISYAVFCLKKKKQAPPRDRLRP